jgi:hypothetical protein
MPRTLDAALLAAMNLGSFTPYFKLELLDSDRATVLFSTTEVTGFELDGLTAKVSFHDPTLLSVYSTFRLTRGIIVSGVPNTITSSQFYPRVDRHEKRIRTIEGHVFPIAYYSTPGDVTYSQIITTICTTFGLSVVHADPAAAYLSYQFYPTGRTFTMNDVKQFFTVLRQKYLVFATDLGNDSLYFYQANLAGPAYPAGYTVIKPGLALVPGQGSLKYKSFLSRDENNTTHTSGLATSPLHNLGFLPSTASHPDRTYFYDTNDWIVRDIPPNLKYLDFDAFRVYFDIATIVMYPVKVRELFDQKLHPSWQYQARFLDVFGTTEGGAIPSTIEASAPYTPLNVSNFNKNLNTSQNNLQAFADAVDDMTCGPAIFAAASKPIPDDADLFPLVDSDTVTHLVRNIQWSDIKGVLREYFDSLDDGWIPCSEGWTRTGNHQFTVNGDLTSKFHKGIFVRYNDGGSFEYGVVGSSSYAAPDTTVNLIPNDDYAMAAVAITDKSISHVINPAGWPTWFNFSSTLTWTGTPPSNPYLLSQRWCAVGDMIYINIYDVWITPGATVTRVGMTLPIYPTVYFPSFGMITAGPVHNPSVGVTVTTEAAINCTSVAATRIYFFTVMNY